MSGPDRMFRDGAHHWKYQVPVACLCPFFVSLDIVRIRIANSIRRVLPVSGAEHFVIETFVLEHAWPFNGVPAHAAFLQSPGIENVPVEASTRNRLRGAGEGIGI